MIDNNLLIAGKGCKTARKNYGIDSVDGNIVKIHVFDEQKQMSTFKVELT